MGFNRRKLEAERKAMIMGERTRHKLQCVCGNTGWAERSDNDPVVDVSPGFSWAKGHGFLCFLWRHVVVPAVRRGAHGDVRQVMVFRARVCWCSPRPMLPIGARPTV